MNVHPRTQPIYNNWKQSPSGLAVPPFYQLKAKRPVAVDLFSGAGGFSLGLLNAGFDVIAACDNEPWAAITYLVNLGAYPLHLVCLTPEDEQRLEKTMRQHMGYDDKSKTVRKATTSGCNLPPDFPGVAHYFFGDIRKLTGQMILDATGLQVGDIDLVCGGPPCQGFSMAGKRDVMDPRNSLVFEFVRMILELMPKMMVMENVPGIASMVTPEGLPVVDAVCMALEKGGWGAFDAIKRTLMHNKEAGAALRTKVKRGDDLDDDEENAQLGLFGE